MTDSEHDDLHTILQSQLRMEMNLSALSTAHHEHCSWTRRVLSGDDSDTTPGLIKQVDRLDQSQKSALRWLSMLWAIVVAAAGSLLAWLLNSGASK